MLKSRKKIIILISFTFFVLCTGLFIGTIHSFLAPVSPIHGEILVVEGWMRYHALKQAAELFKKGNYRYIITVGGPVAEHVDWQIASYARNASTFLQRFGIQSDLILTLPCQYTKKHRTILSAATLNAWLSDHEPGVVSIDLVTESAHGRKSHIIYSKICKPRLSVGIISVSTDRYNPLFWYLTSRGISFVFRNIAGYVYALFVNIDKVKDHLQNPLLEQKGFFLK